MERSLVRLRRMLPVNLALVLLTMSPQHHQAEAAVSQGATLVTTCKQGCEVPITIDAVSNKGRMSGGGHRIEVRWRLGTLPAGMKINSLMVFVEVDLQRGRVQKGGKRAEPDDRIALIEAKGLVTDGDPISFKVTITPSAVIPLKEQVDARVLETKFIEQRFNGNLVVEVRYRVQPKNDCYPASQIGLEAGMLIQVQKGHEIVLIRRSKLVSARALPVGTEQIVIDAGPREIPITTTLTAEPRLTGETLVGCGVSKSGRF